MPTQNNISIAISAADLTKIDDALAVIESIINPIAVALSPEENQLYGKLGPETENHVRMVYEDTLTFPALKPAQVDGAEWKKDIDARNALMPRLTRTESIYTKMNETMRLLGYEINDAKSATYKYVQYMVSQNEPGFSTYFDKWKVQFAKMSGRPAKTPPTS